MEDRQELIANARRGQAIGGLIGTAGGVLFVGGMSALLGWPGGAIALGIILSAYGIRSAMLSTETVHLLNRK